MRNSKSISKLRYCAAKCSLPDTKVHGTRDSWLPAKVDYHSWSKADLVSEARRRNLATSGNKQDLVDRLATADEPQ